MGPAEEPGLAVEALARLAERAGVTVSGHAEESACAAVELLRTGGGGRFARWLVVLDNAAASSALDSTMVDELLGAAELGGGHVLITSRDLGWARLAAPVEVNVRTRSKRESVSA